MAGFNFVLTLRAMGSMAAALGNPGDAARYSALAAAATSGFHAAFYNASAKAYGDDAGAVQSLTLPALDIGAPPAAIRAAVVQSLEDDLAQRTDYHLRVGAVTAKILLNVLSENGLHAAAMRVATQTTLPSWGFWLTQNATTCWETFAGCAGVGCNSTLNPSAAYYATPSSTHNHGARRRWKKVPHSKRSAALQS